MRKQGEEGASFSGGWFLAQTPRSACKNFELASCWREPPCLKSGVLKVPLFWCPGAIDKRV